MQKKETCRKKIDNGPKAHIKLFFFLLDESSELERWNVIGILCLVIMRTLLIINEFCRQKMLMIDVWRLKNNAKSANIRCLAAIKSRKNIFTTFFFTSNHSALTSCRHNGYSTWVTEALKHRIANQRYQHVYFLHFSLINRNEKVSFF